METVLAVVALAALLAAAYYIGRRMEKRRTHADYRALCAELDTQYAALISIPEWEYAHRQEVAIENRARQAETRARLDAYFLDLRGAA